MSIPEEAVNRCAAEALTLQNPRLKGLGIATSITAVGFVALSVYVVIEMWMTNRILQNLPSSLYPRHEADPWITRHQEGVESNRMLISEAAQLLQTIHRKLYFAFILGALALVLFTLTHFDQSWIVFILNPVLIGVGLIFVVGYTFKNYLRTPRGFLDPLSSILFHGGLLAIGLALLIGVVFFVDELPLYWVVVIGFGLLVVAFFYTMDFSVQQSSTGGRLFDFRNGADRVFHLRDRIVSPVFLCLLILVQSFLLGQYYWMYRLLANMVIC